jgi:hypothetical protein
VAISYQERILALWTVFLLGILFHAHLTLVPLFHDQSAAIASAYSNVNIAYILWGMLGFFILPMFAIIITTFNDSRRYRMIHFSVTIFYTILNLLHVGFDLLIQPIVWYQITLMMILFSVGLLLNLVSLRWLKHPYEKYP